MYIDPAKISFIGRHYYIIDTNKLSYSGEITQEKLEKIKLAWFKEMEKKGKVFINTSVGGGDAS